jgi:hypothetical protein
MPESLMSEARHECLIKAAEETIGLMNIGVDGNAALAKVAEDSDLNDHEVEIVAHAINNSKQLAHLQSSKPEDRENAFPLVDPKAVKVHQEEPTTNADVETGNRYGSQDTPSQSAEDRFEGNDALDIQKEVSKEASVQDFRTAGTKVDHAAALREGWGLQQAKVAQAQVKPNQDVWAPFRKLSGDAHVLQDASRAILELREAAEGVLAKLAYELRRTDAPKWAGIEKAAAASGVSSDTIDLVYNTAGLEKFGEARADLTKTASDRIFVSAREAAIVELCVRADTIIKEAGELVATRDAAQNSSSAAELDLLGVKTAGEAQSYAPGAFVEGGSIKFDPGAISKEFETAPQDILSPDNMMIAAGGKPTGAEAPELSYDNAVGQGFRQDVANIDARGQIEGLMKDDYIGGHELPEVIEAYNAAMSVNPNFGRAELVSYIRQHLATKGGVPLDLQIRARNKGQSA